MWLWHDLNLKLNNINVTLNLIWLWIWFCIWLWLRMVLQRLRTLTDDAPTVRPVAKLAIQHWNIRYTLSTWTTLTETPDKKHHRNWEWDWLDPSITSLARNPLKNCWIMTAHANAEIECIKPRAATLNFFVICWICYAASLDSLAQTDNLQPPISWWLSPGTRQYLSGRQPRTMTSMLQKRDTTQTHTEIDPSHCERHQDPTGNEAHGTWEKDQGAKPFRKDSRNITATLAKTAQIKAHYNVLLALWQPQGPWDDISANLCICQEFKPQWARLAFGAHLKHSMKTVQQLDQAT